MRTKLGLIGLVSLLSVPIYSHTEPDFDKLPNVRKIDRYIISTSLLNKDIKYRKISQGTMFKLGENNGKYYYATVNHLNKVKLPKHQDTYTIHSKFYSNNQIMEIEGTDPINDIMIISTTDDFGDSNIKKCKTPPKIGENNYVYGYHGGILAIGEGRIGNLESKIIINKRLNNQSYYVSDADVIPGASGSPSILYRENDFCVYGMLLASIETGVFSISSDIKYTFELYENILNAGNINKSNNLEVKK